jgi:Ca2+-binding RTX toxin-like protein
MAGTVSIGGTFTGDDKLYGADGDDFMNGQVGDDVLDGGMGNDFMDGGTQTAGVGDIAAFNTLNVAVSADLVLGFAFGQGNDILAGFESIRGSNRGDNLAGDNLANQIEGLDGNDRIFGRGGNDTLIGGKGADAIKGGTGNDTITGGADADTLTGQAGADVFDYNAVSESGLVAATRDVILSFVQGAGGDRIDVNTIDAQAGLGGNQNFAFIGGAAFSAEGQVRFTVSGGHTLVELNTTGAAGAEMSIDLAGVFALAASDFIL